MAHLVLALDRGLTLADTRQELPAGAPYRAFPRREDLPLNPSARALAQDALQRATRSGCRRRRRDGACVLDRAGLSMAK